MRILTLFIIALFVALPATAQEESQAPALNEGAGLIRSDLQGAFPKGLWRNQNRSEINFLLHNMPAYSPSRAVQQIKRNLLISQYETTDIINDEENQKDLLTARLEKLLETGFWDDALNLYTKNIDDPEKNEALARVGVLLILNQKGLSTACLEEKVLSSRFQDVTFWQNMDLICSQELGTAYNGTLEFSNSSILQGVFFDPNFKIMANDLDLLSKATPLEISILSLKQRLDYAAVDLSKSIPPYLVKTYSKDEQFPEKFKPALEDVARQLALMPLADLTEEQTEKMESASSLTQSYAAQLTASLLRSGQDIPAPLTARFLVLSATNPQNFYYLKIMEEIGAVSPQNNILPDEVEAGKAFLRKNHPQDVILLQTLLDNGLEFSNNPDTAYEKQVSLTPDGDYVMSVGSLTEWLGKTKIQNYVGLSLLIILSNDEYFASGHAGNALIKNLSNVGLIDQAHLIARENLAQMMMSLL